MKLLLLLLVSTPLIASAPYGILVDPHLSPYAGAETLLLADKIPCRYIKRLTSTAFPVQIVRALELCLVWDPLAQVAMVTQHEVFGHGFRIRSLGSSLARVGGYWIDPPRPYGHGGGSTGYFTSPALTTSQKLAITSGGVEATAIMAGELKKKWLIDGSIDGRQAALYNYAEQDLTFYALFMGSGAPGPSNNDMLSYIYWLNRTYPKGSLSKGRLRSYALINFIDPMSYYAVYSWFRYIASAQNGPIPMIPFGPSTSYLPNLRLGLTPFGPEAFLENNLLWRRQLIYCYLKGGSFASNHYYGLGVENKTLLREGDLMLGLRFDGWLQPPYSSFLVTSAKKGLPAPLAASSNKIGASLIGTLYWLLKPASLYVALGYKSRGFLPGESLSATPIFRIGLFCNL